ncbi:hypothetical protein [Rhodopirellula sp. MGV]|uniref:hypothetical protein n=1 Tax=Rhodopirellula sp. MGV TaxID=2023130 RepID=UPI000B96FC4D|nr:hypothetical protein [Rhodopirellula sp. MGV]OYP31107.1 hypothetical protein CGZ80_21640 [Rhodopirellula sp. MGV]PNY37481.1 hypothetical protein C2E31_08155 [Rhodopirellula baltica]
MVKKIALDYDGTELRLVVANVNGGKVSVSDVQLIPIAEGESVSEKLRRYITDAGLQRTETLVAIGRGKAELRELSLPPVPNEELPDMVRFQAIRSFALASDRAIVDFLVTERSSEAVTLIAAAIPPTELDRERELCSTSELPLERLALRPLAAASLYLSRQKTPDVCVMIDLLANDAEIVVAREGKVIFVRTVRLPEGEEHRQGAIVSELRRTMMACGESATPSRIVVWGNAAVHAGEVAAIQEKIGCENVEAVSPFDLVDVSLEKSKLPAHSGRFAPLVGLLASSASNAEALIDFMNPRKRPEEKPDHLRRIALIAVPVAAVFLIGFLIYRQFSQWDSKIAILQDEVNQLLPSVEMADESIAKTEEIDKFLDRDVNWLDELRRFAELAPPSDKMIVRSLAANSLTKGGGYLRIGGNVTESGVIDKMQTAIRDDTHSVVVKDINVEPGEDKYRWSFTQTITVDGPEIRNVRYQRMDEQLAATAEQAVPTGTTEETSKDQEEAAPETSSKAPAETPDESPAETPATEPQAEEVSA